MLRKRMMLAAIMVLIVALASCQCGSQSESEEVDLGAFQTELGEYAFPDLEWGISPSETSESIGISIGEPIEGWSADALSNYIINSFHKIDGISVDTKLQFSNNKLHTVSLGFVAEPDEADILYDRFADKMTSVYGEGEPTSIDGTLGKQNYRLVQLRWRADVNGRTTMLFLSKTTREGFAPRIEIVVGVAGINP